MSEDIARVVQDAVKEAVHKELGEYKIPKEQHYVDHLWLKEWREWQATIKNSTVRSVVGIVISAMALLLLYGFMFFKDH